MDVAFYDPYKPDGYDKSLGIRRVEKFDDLLKQAFVLSVHCPLTPETKNIVDARAIALMPGRFVSREHRSWGDRGRDRDSGRDSLRQARRRRDRRITARATARRSPPTSGVARPNDPCFDRVIVNPHAAFYAEEGLLDMRVKGAQACRRALLDEPLRNVVN